VPPVAATASRRRSCVSNVIQSPWGACATRVISQEDEASERISRGEPPSTGTSRIERWFSRPDTQKSERPFRCHAGKLALSTTRRTSPPRAGVTHTSPP
jgi:hypothetical protein